MNIASKKFFIVLASAVLVIGLAGCKKKPVRPDPSATQLGPNPGGDSAALNAQTTNPASDLNSGLSPRTDGIDENGQIKDLLGAVYFDFDSSSIKPAEREKIKAAKDYLAKNPTYRILFEGHCDWRGTDEYNLSLGDRRATAAKKYLISLGVDAAKVESNSKGSLEATKNADDATRAKDRRAQIIVLTK